MVFSQIDFMCKITLVYVDKLNTKTILWKVLSQETRKSRVISYGASFNLGPRINSNHEVFLPVGRR
jgi:hypothetical protein